MSRGHQLAPRNGHTLKVLIVARISGCQNQKEMSLDDQADHAKEEIAELYDGPCEYHVIATKGKGERLDRPELQQVEDRLNRSVDDVLVMEDVGRLVRGTAAVEIWGIAVDHGIRCIAPNDGCDTADPTWEEDLISACKDHVSHCAHTSRRIKHKQMNRFKRNGGATPLPTYGYHKPKGAKYYSDWQKVEAATLHLKAGLDVLKRTRNWTAVAEYFNGNSIPTGPYCRKEVWDGAMVKRLYHNPTLRGTPQRGARHSIKHNKSGRRISEVNPEGPRYRDEPHLAHFEGDDAVELDAILKDVDDGNKRLGRGRTETLERNIGGGKRSRFPGRCAVCWYCGRTMVWGGNGIRTNLMCNGSRQYKCWNSVGFDGMLATERIVAAIKAELERLEGATEQFSDMVHAALIDTSNDEQERRLLEADEMKWRVESDNIAAAIRQTGPHAMLNDLLRDLDEQKRLLDARRRALDRNSQRQLQLPLSAVELSEQFDLAAKDLANDSYDFADIMRSLVTGLHVYLVRLVDGGSLVPRAKVTLCLGGFLPDMSKAPGMQEYLTRELTIDLFEEPTRERIREQVVEQITARAKQREIAIELGTHQATIQRALRLDRLMRDRGLTSPYELVTEPPTQADNRKMKRHRHLRYRFEPKKGYEPPLL
ncbi:MAG: recombinase family protein [Planctomycetaceae bacterium]|nr:recombinase family protein [Planctomycetaceae bacterium]MCB9953670.1 recombinase family protein [Planctomycetaceae bacterium]